MKPTCNCSASTGIHEGLTFGSGKLDDWGYWEKPCTVCARWHEQKDNVPVNSYWPFQTREELQAYMKDNDAKSSS